MAENTNKIIGYFSDIPIYESNWKPNPKRTPTEKKCLHEIMKLLVNKPFLK